jgi:endonuclease G
MDALQRVAAAARARARRSLKNRREVLNEVFVRGHRLQAEPSMARRIRVVTERVGVKGLAAEAIARGVDPTTIETLTEAQLRLALALQGKTVDFQEVVALEKARIAAHAVGRVVAGKQGIGTCFMISPELLITNHHVIEDAAHAATCEVEFNFEVDTRGSSRPVTRFALAPEKFCETDERTHMDFTVVALGSRLSGTRTVANLGFCRITADANKHALGDFVNIIQHPGGEHKQVVMRENLLVHRGRNVLLYNADTNGGSSGSPVFNDEWQVVALHHFAGASSTIRLENGVELPDTVNEGIRASRIALELLRRRAALTDEQRAMLERAIDPSDAPEEEDDGGDDGDAKALPLPNAA